MNKIFLIVLAALFCSCQSVNVIAQSPNSLSSQERSEGWQLLFDGQTTRGWHKYGGAPIGAAWKVQDGALWLDPSQKEGWQIKGGGDIVTDEVFTDFHLMLEWKIAQNGNSGIMFYIHEDSTKYQWPWMTAPEMQVLDNQGHPDAKIVKHRAGDLYDLISCRQETVKPFEQWNQVEIICKKGKLDFFLNSVNVVSVQLWGEEWKKMVAASKFSKMPGFGTYQEGRIGLQDHGDKVWYRNIKIKRL
jgi:hypothetical protein